MKTPKRLTEDDRVIIAGMHKAGHTQKEIAAVVHFSRSTISRNLKRNRCSDGVYRTEIAQSLYLSRKKRPPYKLKGRFGRVDAAGLRRGESPYSIGISMREKRLPAPGIESIHRFVARDAAEGGTLWIFLPMKRMRRRPHRKTKLRHGPIPRRVDISKRPVEANERSQIGNWEGDTVHGAGPDEAAIVTLICRKTRYLLMEKAGDLKSATVAKSVEKMLRPHRRNSITFDNGSEFAKHERISERLWCPCYFARAGHPGAARLISLTDSFVAPQKEGYSPQVYYAQANPWSEGYYQRKASQESRQKATVDYLSELLAGLSTKN